MMRAPRVGAFVVATLVLACQRAPDVPPGPPMGVADNVPRYGIFEQVVSTESRYRNPYTDVQATASLTGPDGTEHRIPLFWDGKGTWKLRFSPDSEGAWHWSVEAEDAGLNGRQGSFRCVASTSHGGLGVHRDRPHHFMRQDGTPFWWFGETAWSAFGSNAEEGLDRAAAQRHIDRRASQGFNVVLAHLLSEGNEGGLPFRDYDDESLNPAFWQEVDRRLAHINRRGMTAVVMLAWGADGQVGDWEGFPDDRARRRYARYVTARYSAADVIFCVAGEWDEFGGLALYETLAAAIAAHDPHGRLVTNHATEFADNAIGGSARMSFGDFQQQYDRLHERILAERKYGKPVVNAEYGYYLRDKDGDGVTDKRNSATVDEMRHATYDIAMAGGYFITGWGTTYLGGRRDPGPFNPEDPRNAVWETQVQYVPALFESLEWWALEPTDALVEGSGILYCLAEPGRQYVVYAREAAGPLSLAVEEGGYEIRRFDPRTGEQGPSVSATGGPLTLEPPDGNDWVFVVRAVSGGA